MADPRKVVAFIFSYAKRRPNSKEELRSVASIALQLHRLGEAESKGKIEQAARVLSWTTNRKSAFFERPEFRDAMETAARLNASLAIDDLSALFSAAPPEKVIRGMHALDASIVDVWDNRLGAAWQSLPPQERVNLVSTAIRSRAIRSSLVKAGLSISKNQASSAGHSNFRKGVEGNVRRANRAAYRLEKVVIAEVAKRPPGSTLSPTALARSLNGRNIPSARGGNWSHNTAKDLLDRVLRMQKSSAAANDQQGGDG